MNAEEHERQQEAASRADGQPQRPSDLVGGDDVVAVQVLGEHDDPDDDSDAV